MNGAASFIHFAHNAEHLAAYPNLPASFSRGLVYIVWVAIAAIGVTGDALRRYGAQLIGLALVGVYAVLGFGGLLHYGRAPLTRHTPAMNLTIGFEVVTAAYLLVVVSGLALGQLAKR